jgi:hypothetical protein
MADWQPAAGGGRGLALGGDWEQWQFGPYERFAPLQQRVAEYWLMRTYEPTVRRVLAVLRGIILAKLGSYYHPDQALAEQVNRWLGRIEGGPTRLMGDLLSAMWAGFAVLEPEWELTEREWTIERARLLHPLSFFNRQGGSGEDKGMGIRLDKRSHQVEELTQYPGGYEGQPVTHTRADVVYWPLFQELPEQVYGCSLLDGARRAWFSKVRLEAYWNTYGEKCAMPTPIFRVPQGTTEDANGEEISWAQFLARFWEQVRPGMAVGLPLDPDTPFDISFLQVEGNGEAFAELVRYWKTELYNAMLTPQLVVEEAQHNTRSQTESVLDLFYLLVDGVRGEGHQVMVDQVARPLIIANRGEMDNYGEWRPVPLRNKDLEPLARILENVERARGYMVQRGGFEPADDRKIRETFSELYAPAEEVGNDGGGWRVVRNSSGNGGWRRTRGGM